MMTTPKTGRPRGRPQLNFLNDPERIACALGRAFVTLGVSENDAFKRVAALIHGEETSRDEMPFRRKRGRGFVPAGNSVGYEFRAVRGGSAGSLVGRASTLRKKATDTQLNPEAAVWLMLWTMHIGAFLVRWGLTNAEVSTLFVVQLTDQMNNGILTEAQVLTALGTAQPDFNPND